MKLSFSDIIIIVIYGKQNQQNMNKFKLAVFSGEDPLNKS